MLKNTLKKLLPSKSAQKTAPEQKCKKTQSAEKQLLLFVLTNGSIFFLLPSPGAVFEPKTAPDAREQKNCSPEDAGR